MTDFQAIYLCYEAKITCDVEPKNLSERLHDNKLGLGKSRASSEKFCGGWIRSLFLDPHKLLFCTSIWILLPSTMGASPSGTLTLLFLVFIGPLVYAGHWLYKKMRGVEMTGDPDHVEKEGEREQLSSKQYLFALVGYAIGIGIIWRFPYVIASNGGAAALFAYLVCAVLVAVPLFLYELIIGQSIRLSTIRCYDVIHPRWKSVGYASGAMLFVVLAYYAQIVAYTLPYLIDSCKDPLPWIEKGAEKHWREGILDAYGPDEEKNGLGGIVPSLAISLFCFWIITLLSASFGSEILSKITYVTVCKEDIAMQLEGMLDLMPTYSHYFSHRHACGPHDHFGHSHSLLGGVR